MSARGGGRERPISDDDDKRYARRPPRGGSGERERRRADDHRRRDQDRYHEGSDDGNSRRSGYRRSKDDPRRDRAKEHRRERRQRSSSSSQDGSRNHHHRRSRSPAPAKYRSKSPPRKSRGPLPSQDESFRGGDQPLQPGAALPPVKEKPNYKPTGLLAKEANTIAGTTTVLKYHEPPESRLPSSTSPWRLYVFRVKNLLSTIHLYSRSAWLLGRDKAVADIHVEHPSISKQHAVIQFRFVQTTDEFGDKKGRVKPYLIDLESGNGTKLNGRKVEARRFVELVDGDVVGFGESEREYVLMLPPKDG